MAKKATLTPAESTVEVKIDMPPPGPPPFDFYSQLKTIHTMITATPGYRTFIMHFTAIQTVRLATAFSFLLVVIILSPDLDDLRTRDYIAFSCLGLTNILGRLTPILTNLLVDDFKKNLSVEQATRCIEKLFELEHSATLSTPTGEFAQLIAKVFQSLDKVLPGLYGQMLPVAIETFVGTIIIATCFGWISIAQPLLFVCYTIVAYKGAKKKAERNKDLMAAFFSQWGKILATAGSYERAHFFGNVQHEVDNATDAFQYIADRMAVVLSGDHKEAMALQFISLSLTAVFCGAIISPALAESVTGLEKAALTFYFFLFISSLDQYALGISTLRTAVVEPLALDTVTTRLFTRAPQYQKLDEFLAQISGVRDIENPIVLLPKKKPIIEFKNVTFSYGGEVILDDVSFKVTGGDTLGVVGSSGCGKSTIMRLLLRFYRQSSGVILVDGEDIRNVSGDSLRNLFSVVTQDAALFNASIRDNIGYGKMGSSDEDILKAAGLAELTLKETSSSASGGEEDLSLDKVCGEKGGKLSGGQQQRVSLARAMLKKGTIYLLDEPTTGLDGVVARSLQKTLDELSTEATSICITHHLEDLKNVGQIIYLDGGKVVERGNFAELMKLKGTFYEQVEARK